MLRPLLSFFITLTFLGCDFSKDSPDADGDWSGDDTSSTSATSGGGGGTSESEDEDEGWGSETTGDVDADGTDDGGGDDGSPPLENPTITLAGAVCLEGTEAFWKLDLIASDPQGLNTLGGEANCDIYPAGATEGTAIHSVTLGCGLGACSQNYGGADEGVLCSAASDWEFRFTIADEDGYVSTVEVVVGSVD
jgi:hypothetical protein